MLDISDGETIEPLIPLLTEMALDTDEIRFLCHVRVILLVVRTALSPKLY